MERVEAIKNVIEEMSNEEFIMLYMDYSSYYGAPDEYIYNMCDLSDLMCGVSFVDGLEKIDFGNFDPHDDYVIDTIYGLRSGDADDVYDVISYYIDDIAEKIDEEENSLYNDDIQAILDDIAA